MKTVKDRIKILSDNISETLFAVNNETQWINGKIDSMAKLKYSN